MDNKILAEKVEALTQDNKLLNKRLDDLEKTLNDLLDKLPILSDKLQPKVFIRSSTGVIKLKGNNNE